VIHRRSKGDLVCSLPYHKVQRSVRPWRCIGLNACMIGHSRM